MKLHRLPVLATALLLVFTACQKEVSVELSGSTAAGSLQADAGGECLPKTVQGIYETGKVLDPSVHFIDVQVNVTAVGAYRVYSDTINGIFFQGSGSFATTGVNTVRISGTGTPLNAGPNIFSIKFDNSSCAVTINTVAPGGGTQAVFEVTGAPDQCQNPVIAGVYTAGVALTAANTVALSVNVTVAGTYAISTTQSNGIVFSGSGTFANTGAQTVTLAASGTPVVEAATNIPVPGSNGTCTFTINVTAPQSFDYFPRTAGSNWSYEFDDDPDDSIMIRAKPGTTDLGGNAYNIFEGTADLVADGFQDIGAYRKAGNDYYTYVDIGYFFGFDDAQFIEYIFLKDNLPETQGWYTPEYTGNVTDSTGTYSFTLRLALTIVQKDVTVTVGGTAYPNTIVVNEKYELRNGNQWLDATPILGHYRSYYARSVGLIRQEVYYEDGNANPTTVVSKQDLRRHVIL